MSRLSPAVLIHRSMNRLFVFYPPSAAQGAFIRLNYYYRIFTPLRQLFFVKSQPHFGLIHLVKQTSFIILSGFAILRY